MAKRDYYRSSACRDASEADIKKAYRRLAMKFHPDRNPDDTRRRSKFKEAKEAYEVLSDAQKRAAYDQFGHAGVDGSAAAAAAGFDPRDAFGDIFGDVFGDIFGGGRRGRSQVLPRRGPALRARARPRAGRVRRHRRASSSDAGRVRRAARAAAPAKGSKPVTCETCHGAGQVRMQQGFFTVQQTCPRCRGRGQVIERSLRHLPRPGPRAQAEDAVGQGAGRRRHRRPHPPVGRGRGRAQRRAAGDLYVEVRVREHAIFERDGSHLSCEVPVSFARAALGGTVEVPTLDGTVTLKIPPETQSGRVFRLRDKGVKPVRGGADRRPVLPGGGRDAGQSDARAEGAAARSSRTSLQKAATPAPPARGVPGSTA